MYSRSHKIIDYRVFDAGLKSLSSDERQGLLRYMKMDGLDTARNVFRRSFVQSMYIDQRSYPPILGMVGRSMVIDPSASIKGRCNDMFFCVDKKLVEDSFIARWVKSRHLPPSLALNYVAAAANCAVAKEVFDGKSDTIMFFDLFDKSDAHMSFYGSRPYSCDSGPIPSYLLKESDKGSLIEMSTADLYFLCKSEGKCLGYIPFQPGVFRVGEGGYQIPFTPYMGLGNLAALSYSKDDPGRTTKERYMNAHRDISGHLLGALRIKDDKLWRMYQYELLYNLCYGHSIFPFPFDETFYHGYQPGQTVYHSWGAYMMTMDIAAKNSTVDARCRALRAMFLEDPAQSTDSK